MPENARLPRNIQVSFICRKYRTWDRRLYFPSEGRRTGDFFALKNPTASVGFEPANLGTKGQHATSRPPKPLINTYFCFSCGMMERPGSELSGSAKCRNNVHFLQVPEQLSSSRIQVHAVDETCDSFSLALVVIIVRRQHTFIWVVITLRCQHIWVVCSARCLCST